MKGAETHAVITLRRVIPEKVNVLQSVLKRLSAVDEEYTNLQEQLRRARTGYLW